jgi:hypothetical protein
MPRHTGALQNRELVASVVIYIMEVHDTCVVVILAWEECLGEVGRVDISERMGLSVPATEAEVEATDRSVMIVHHDNLLRNDDECYRGGIERTGGTFSW